MPHEGLNLANGKQITIVFRNMCELACRTNSFTATAAVTGTNKAIEIRDCPAEQCSISHGNCVPARIAIIRGPGTVSANFRAPQKAVPVRSGPL